jgi:hypothetical protein
MEGRILLKKYKFDKAIEFFKKAKDILDKIHGEDSE